MAALTPVLRPPPTQQLGGMMSPQPLVQGTPPSDQNEFAARFDELQTFLKRPDVRAGLLQFAAAVLQPTQPGTPPISAIANAVGAGGQAVRRVQTTEEARRRQEVTERQQQQRLGFVERQTTVAERRETRETQEGKEQIDIARGRLGVERALLGLRGQELKAAADQFRETTRLKEVELDQAADQFTRRLVAEAGAAERTFERSLIEQSAKIEAARVKAVTEQLKVEIENLELTSPGTPERQAVVARIEQLRTEAQFNPDNARRVHGTLKTINAPPTEGGTQAAPNAADEAISEAIRAGRAPEILSRPDVISRITPEQRQRLEEAVQQEQAREDRLANLPKTLTPKQVQELERRVTNPRGAGGRVVPRTEGERVLQALTSPAPETALSGDPSLQALAPTRPTRMDIVRTPEEFAQLPDAAKDAIQQRLAGLFPEGAPPQDATIWRIVLQYPILQAFVRGRYGEKGERLIAQAQQQMAEGRQVRQTREQEETRRRERLRGALSGE